ncbi:MAG: HlyD family efflux transporter periplasmic adaptor subunit [Acidobacteria bacterium]|jgi:membrane fusion protein (multidrug efflux system)|nr:MAG: HlyD family efflux transporter periplasmic adaptor subunit [Acidobacteriota bacterium]
MKKVGVVLLIVLILLFSFLSFRWIKHRMDYAISDAVFVRAEVMTNLSFEVSGQVLELYKDMGDRVKKGELLGKLDRRDYELQVDMLRAKIEALRSQREGLLVQLERVSKKNSLNLSISQKSLEELSTRERALQSQLREIDLLIEQARRDKERLENLLREGLVPLKRFEEAKTNYETLLQRRKVLEESLKEVSITGEKLRDNVGLARAELLSTEELRKQVDSLSAEIGALEKQLQKAELDLSRSELRAPFDGVIAKRFVSSRDIVRAGQPIYSLVDESSYYVEVLLEETKLKGVRVGALAIVRLDAYPDKVFEGTVEDISPASAATFALVPRDVSAGEFTKVVQRVPVKIRLKGTEGALLRVGMGGRVEIKRQ